MSKTFGEGIFSAHRQDGALHVSASGHKPTAQTKVSLEQLPFLIFPPRIGLLFDTDGITSPVEVPYDLEKAFPAYPASSKVVTVIDEHGAHTIDIVEKPASTPPLRIADPGEASFVVYHQTGTTHYLIAKAEDLVIAIYVKVFGPDSYAHCQAYVAEHAHSDLTVDLIKDTLKARIEGREGETGQELVVTVDAFVEVDWDVTLVEAEPQGINPKVKLLKLEIELPEGPIHSHAIARRTLRYEEAASPESFTGVTIENCAQTVSANVETGHQA